MCDLLSVIKNGSWNSGESAYLSKGKNTKIPLGTGHYFWPGGRSQKWEGVKDIFLRASSVRRKKFSAKSHLTLIPPVINNDRSLTLS